MTGWVHTDRYQRWEDMKTDITVKKLYIYKSYKKEYMQTYKMTLLYFNIFKEGGGGIANFFLM